MDAIRKIKMKILEFRINHRKNVDEKCIKMMGKWHKLNNRINIFIKIINHRAKNSVIFCAKKL